MKTDRERIAAQVRKLCAEKYPPKTPEDLCFADFVQLARKAASASKNWKKA